MKKLDKNPIITIEKTSKSNKLGLLLSNIIIWIGLLLCVWGIVSVYIILILLGIFVLIVGVISYTVFNIRRWWMNG